MKVKELCMIAVMAAIEQIVFTSFSFILYLECITFTIVVFAMVFQTKSAVLASIVFVLLNFTIQGVTPWTCMYALIYPSYSLLIGLSKNFLQKHLFVLAILCGFFSFLTGQLLQLPFMLFSRNITILYIIVGLKTSLIQMVIAATTCFVCYQPVYKVLKFIERRIMYA